MINSPCSTKKNVSCPVFPVVIDNIAITLDGKKKEERKKTEQRRKGKRRSKVGRKEVKKEESPRFIPNSLFLSLFTPVHHHILLAQTPKSYLKLLIFLCKLFLL